MSNLKISLAEVSECASRIRHANQIMFDELSSMKKEMNDTNISWISEGGENIRMRFNQFAARFDTQREAMESYARFLDTTVSSYDTLETTITNNASSMQA